MEEIKTSKHSRIRMRERTELNHKERRMLFKRALTLGKSVKEIKEEKIKRYLSSKQKINSKVKLYQGYVFVYSKNSHQLYTMYKLPKRFIEGDEEKS